MTNQIIARGKVIEHPSAPATLCISMEPYGWLWPVPRWAWERDKVRVGQVIVISLEEKEEEQEVSHNLEAVLATP